MKSLGGPLLLASALIVTATSAASAQSSTGTLQGTVASGGGINQQAIAGAGIRIYQAYLGGTRTLGAGISGQDGKFNITLKLNDDPGIVYAVAHKGPKIELVTVIGANVPANITINEMTTVAAAYSMARIYDNGVLRSDPLLPIEVAAGMAADLVSADTGMPSPVMQTSPNGNETNAWRSLGTLANILAGCVRNGAPNCRRLFRLTTPPGGVAPANTLEAMIDIARHPAANLKPLFELGGTTKVFEPNLAADVNGPDAPDRLMRLDAFTLAIKFNATGRVDANGNELCPFGGPGNFVFDKNGYIWITNNVVQGTTGSAACMVVLKPNGQPADGTHRTPSSPVFGGGVLGQGFGLGFAPDGTVWSGNFGWGGVNPTDSQGNPAGSVSHFTRGGEALSPAYGYTSNLYRVQGTVSDRHGNIWMASYGNSGVQIFPAGNPETTYPLYQDANTNPFDIRLDSDGSGWVSYTGSSTVSKFVRKKSGLQLQFTVPIGVNAAPKGVAVDSQGDAWVAAGGENAVYAFDKNGNPLGKFSGGGISGPWGAAVDSDDIVWLGNFGPLQPGGQRIKFSVSALCGATVSNCPPGLKLGDPISPKTGYTLPSGGDEVHLHNGRPLYDPKSLKSYQPLMRVTAAHPDAAGNLWATNNWKPDFGIDLASNPGGDGMVVFVGLAAPVLPVLYSAPPVSPFAP